MEILKPELLWIGSRCYRINAVADDEDSVTDAKPTAKNEYVEEGEIALNEISLAKYWYTSTQSLADLYGEDADEEEYNVVEQGPNRFKTSFHVAP